MKDFTDTKLSDSFTCALKARRTVSYQTLASTFSMYTPPRRNSLDVMAMEWAPTPYGLPVGTISFQLVNT